jgi:hypothetical protein
MGNKQDWMSACAHATRQQDVDARMLHPRAGAGQAGVLRTMEALSMVTPCASAVWKAGSSCLAMAETQTVHTVVASAHAACLATATARARRTHVAAEVAECLQVGGADGDAVESSFGKALSQRSQLRWRVRRLRRPRAR